jgi:hypothetical protein
VITQAAFCQQLREQFLVNQDKILLRVVMSSNFERPWEFTGRTLLERAEELASSCVVPKDRAVVLLLLPHSPELFLLQFGLVVNGHVPAILAWPNFAAAGGARGGWLALSCHRVADRK